MLYQRLIFASAATVLGYAAFMTLKEVDWRGHLSTLVEQLSHQPVIEPDLVRDAFATTNVWPVKTTQGHTHPDAAALRTSATNFAREVAAYCGVTLYVLGMSKSDQRKNLRGNRQWFWAKDTHISNCNDQPERDDIEYACDVDYYMNIPSLLIERCKPLLMYTAVPETASSVSDDTTTYFEPDGSLTTLVAGGGRYNHFLWDYGMDSLIVKKKFFGIVTKLMTYAVERKQVGLGRQVILLSPIKSFHGLSAMLASWLVAGRELTRFNPIVHMEDGTKFVRFKVHTRGGTKITTARPRSHLCASIPAEVDEAISIVARLGTTKLMMPTTSSWIGPDDKNAAALMTEYYRTTTMDLIPTVYPVEIGVRAYQYEPSKFDPEARCKVQPFMSPLVHAAFVPVPNAAGERRCVQGRINSLKKEEPRPHAFTDKCIDEFAEFVVAGKHLVPVCYDVVADKQTSTAQKISLRNGTVMGRFRKRVLKCFIKSEAYQDVKDPRNISTYNDGDKLEMAMVALAMSEHCKQFSWYGPGKTPKQIAQRVSDICSASDYVNISDLHRMDGTITYLLRKVDRAVLMKAFKNHRTELNELLKRNCDNTGYLPNGTSFEQGPSHGSGCSATSLFQTLRAAFAAYLGFRNKRYEPRDAFDALGIHLGDDGVDGNLPPENHRWAAEKVGLVLEAHVVDRGERGVNFLARYYTPTVWYGGVDSMCDLKRQLSKFHTTVRLPQGVSPEQKLVEKATSFVATDGGTPVLGPLCKKALLLSSLRPKSSLGIRTWWSRFAESDQYPNTNVGGWMDVELDLMFPEFDRYLFDEWLANAKSVKNLLEAPLCAEPKAPTPSVVDAVVDGTVVHARSVASFDSRETQEEEKTIAVRPRRPSRESKPSRPRKTTERRVQRKLVT